MAILSDVALSKIFKELGVLGKFQLSCVRERLNSSRYFSSAVGAEDLTVILPRGGLVPQHVLRSLSGPEVDSYLLVASEDGPLPYRILLASLSRLDMPPLVLTQVMQVTDGEEPRRLVCRLMENPQQTAPPGLSIHWPWSSSWRDSLRRDLRPSPASDLSDQTDLYVLICRLRWPRAAGPQPALLDSSAPLQLSKAARARDSPLPPSAFWSSHHEESCSIRHGAPQDLSHPRLLR